MEKYKLEQENDLLDIYEKGQLDEFIVAFRKNRKEEEELKGLISYFLRKYFSDFLYPGVDFSNITINEYEKLDDNEKRKFIKPFRKVVVLNKDGLEKEPKYPRLVEISKGRLANQSDPYFERFYVDGISKERKGFVDNYLSRYIQPVRYYGLKEDAKKVNCKKMEEFMNEFPLTPLEICDTRCKRLSKKMLNIRLKHNMSKKEMADYLGCNESAIDNIESFSFPQTTDMVEKYAALDNISPQEFLEFDELIKAYETDQDYARGIFTVGGVRVA